MCGDNLLWCIEIITLNAAAEILLKVLKELASKAANINVDKWERAAKEFSQVNKSCFRMRTKVMQSV